MRVIIFECFREREQWQWKDRDNDFYTRNGITFEFRQVPMDMFKITHGEVSAMTIQFLGVTYQLHDLSSKIFDREIRLRCLMAYRGRNERRKVRTCLWQKVTEEWREGEKRGRKMKFGDIAIWGQKPRALPFKVPRTYPFSAPRINFRTYNHEIFWTPALIYLLKNIFSMRYIFRVEKNLDSN